MRQPDPTFRLWFPPWTGRHRQSFRGASRAGLRITGVGSLLWCSHVSDRINNLREPCEASKTALIALGRVPEGMEACDIRGRRGMFLHHRPGMW